MKASPSVEQQPILGRFNLNRWLQFFLTFIAGTVVALIAWAVFQRLMHIVILLVASFLVAYLLGPLIDRMQNGDVPRPVAILITYVALIIVLVALGILLLTPLTDQLTSLLKILPTLVGSKAGAQSGVDRLLRSHGVALPFMNSGLRTQIAQSISTAGTTVLGSTLSIVAGTVGVVTDILLILVIAFYMLLDGHAMHNTAVRLIPEGQRQRWFFFEATINKVLGGYIRGQLIVALTVGIAAGAGCAIIGVHYPLVIGLLAFFFELIPMIGPVLGMVPAVLISLFQSFQLTLLVIGFFIVLQQVESNVIVPRVSGHAVGLHPLAALLALIIGVEIGGIGFALLAVPLAGVLWVMVMAIYGDATGQTQTLMGPTRHSRYASFTRQMFERRRPKSASEPAASPTASAPVQVATDRLATIQQEQEHLIEQFQADEAVQETKEQERADVAQSERDSRQLEGPDDTTASTVPVGS